MNHRYLRHCLYSSVQPNLVINQLPSNRMVRQIMLWMIALIVISYIEGAVR